MQPRTLGQNLSRRILAILAVLLVGAAGITATASPAQASITDTRADAWGTLELAGSSWLGGYGADVYSNGPSVSYTPDKPSNTVTTPSGASVSSGEKWQCVELVNRLYLTKGWIGARWTGNGGQMYDTAPSGLTKQLNGSITNLKPGDVVVLQDGGAGHAGIVNSVNGTSVQIVNQNTKAVYSSASLNGSTLIMSGWTSYTVKGVVHAPSSGGSGSLSISSPLAISAPGGYYVGAPVNTTFTVKNTSGSSLTVSSLILALRDPYNANYDQTCATGLTLAPGASYTCNFSNWWASTGTYTVIPDWADTNGNWHWGQLGSSQQFTLANPGALVAEFPLAVSGPSGYFANVPIRETFTVKNTTGGSLTIPSLILAVRDPYGVNYDQLCATNLTLAPGAKYTCSLGNDWASTGTYTVIPDWVDGSGNWHWGQLGPAQQFTLAATPALAATAPLAITAPSGYHVNAPVNETFTVKNTTGSSLTLQQLILAVRDPYGDAYDQTCATGLTLAPGATYACTLSNGWASVGTYTVYPDWVDASGNWHWDQLGPAQQFKLVP